MSFSEWSNQNKNIAKKNREEAREEEKAKNTRIALGGKSSFSDWSINKQVDSIDADYINSFITDANSFFGSAEKDYNSIGWSNASSVYYTKRSTLNDLETKASFISKWLERNKSRLDEDTFNNISKTLDSFTNGASSILGAFDEAKTFASQFTTEDAYNTSKARYDVERQALGANDFGHYSQKGTEVANPSWDDAVNKKWLWVDNNEDIVNMVTFAEANEAQAGTQSAQNMNSGGKDKELVRLIGLINSYMTDNEKAVYNYYIGKGDYEKANQYLESLKDVLTQREGGQIAENIKGDKLQEMFFAVAAGLDQFAYGVGNLDNYFKGTEADPLSSVQYAAPAVREDVGDGGWGVAYDLINTTSNMLPSILVGSFTGGFGGALTLGASAVGNGYAEMRNLGYDEWQSRAYGFLVGASETALQYALGGISKLGGKLTGNLVSKLVSTVDNALARTAIKLGGNMASEGLEEIIQSVLEPAFKAWVTGEDFDAPELEEVLYSGLLGALSAGVLEGVPTIAGTIDSSYQTYKQMGGMSNTDAIKAFWKNKKIGDVKSAYKDGKQNISEVAGDYINEALEIDPENAHAQRMQARLDNGKNVSHYQFNRIVNANEQALYSQDTDKIKSAIETRLSELGENGDVSKLVDALVKKASGKSLSISEKNLIKKSKNGSQVSDELNPDNASEWAKKIGTERINAKAYNEDEVIGSFESAVKKVSTAEPPEDESVGENTSSFEVSANGKTMLGDLEVSIKEIASVKDGEVFLRLEDGSTVNASDVEYGSSEEGLLYENVADMNFNAATANAFVKNYDPSMSVDNYAKGFREAYRYGEYGFPVKEMSANGFSAMLTESQKSLAYNLGKTDAKYKIAEKQSKKEKIASIGSIKVGKDSQKTSKKGKLHNSIKPSTERQRASLKALGTLAEALGIDVYTFESREVNGKRQGANGWFDPKDGSIHIDIHAGVNGEGTMLFTAAHELTHFIREWSPAKFKVFADFLLENYGKKGVSVATLVAGQIKKAKDNGRTIDYDTAYEEVIADSCEAMLADGDVISKIAELKAKDKGLWEKIKDFITNLVARIKAAYEGLTPDSYEGQKVAEMLDTAEKLKALWTEALVDASDTYNASEIVDIDTESKSVSPMLSERTWTASEYVTKREKTAKAIAKALNVDINTAYKYIDDINSVARLIADDRVRLDYEPNLDENATVLKPNSEYKYTVDMSTLCAKRLLFTGTFDAIQKALPNMVFDSEDIVSLRKMMQKRGYEVACGICYVESTRREIGRITQDFIDSYKEAQKTGKPITRLNSEGKTVELKKTKEQKETTADKSTDKFYAEKGYTPTLADLNTTDIDLVKRDHPLVYEAYLNFMNARGQAKPKLLETRAEYKGEILQHFKYKSAVNSRNNAGGLRLQSFSDFEVPHLIDMMQIVMDMSRVGLKSQAYTKVPAFAEVFGDTGVKINLSLIAKGDGLDSNGRLVFDDVEGINHKEAFKLRDKYSKNVGTILVGKNDAHIIAAMADPRIDYIIPFHKSSWKESLYDALGLTGYADYTDTQNEKPLDKDRKIKNFDPSEYWDFTKSGDENAQIYLEKCREDGRIPKFPQFQGYPGYWKLLIDFKMYDNDGVGSPQEVVKPVFNTEASERILGKYKGGHKSFPVAKDVVEDFVKEHKDNIKSAPVAEAREFSDVDVKYSIREEAPPTKTEKAYKLMRLVDGKLYPLFIGNNEEISIGTWYNADSPNLSQLKNLVPGTHLVDMKTGEAMTWDEYAEMHVPKKNGKPTRSKPSKDDVHWANDNGYRFMHIEEKAGGKSEGTMLKKYGDTRAYYNWGVNGSSKTESGEGSASLYALRPGWHFGEVPSMHQIGYDGEDGETVRLDNQVWVEVEMSADVDYNAEAEANWSKDIPTHIPTNGYYRFATNPTQKKTKGGNTSNDATKADWYVAGAFKVNRILSDSEADSIVENYNKANGKNVPLDYRRNNGRVFNAETMSIEDSVKYSDRVLMGSLFSGGGTLEAGLAYQMLDKEFGVEYDGKIASVYADNHGDHIQVGRVEDFDISKYDDIFYLHASPVCHNFSKAKHGAKELQMDIDSAKATAKHLETAMPQVFTVENAPGYRKSQSLKIITDKLTDLGYKWDVDVYNSADYGSATSRNRVILRAVKDGELPAKPTKQERTNSWDKVTRDLWDTLPKSYLRPSFISAIENTKNLPILDADGKVNVNKPLLILTTTSGHMVTYCWEGEICPTLTTKCGEAKLVMPDGNIYAVTPEFMGRIQGLPDDYKYPKAKTRAFTIIGNGIPTHLTKAVVGGVLDSAYEQTHNGKVLYSDRTSNAPTFYSYMGKVVDGIKSEKIGANGVVSYLKGKGVKAEEIKWSGIEAFLEGKKSVTKAELQEFVAGSQLTIEEKLGEGGAEITLEPSAYAAFGEDSWSVMRGGELLDTYTWSEDSGLYESDATGGGFSTKERVLEYFKEKYGSGDTRWEQYKLDGGSNYRELVFKMPNSSYSNQAMKTHWGQEAKGVLAHARIQDITTADGKKMLFVEEIQSDWHNAGQKFGYEGDDTESALAAKDYKTMETMLRLLRTKGFMEGDEAKVAEDLASIDVYARALKTFDISFERTHFGGDPSEPLVYVMWWDGDASTVEEDATEFKETIENDLLDIRENTLSHFAHREVAPDAPFRTNYHEYVLKRLLRMAAEEGYDSIGWTPAEIQSERWSEDYAEGYRIEYDQDIPSFLKKYGKKWGAQVAKTPFPSYKPNVSLYDVNRQETYSFIEWQDVVERDLKAQGAPMRNLKYESDDNYWVAYDKVSGMEYDRAEIRKKSGSVWSMDIPDSMKDSVLHEGQVLYSDRTYREGLSEADKEVADKVISGLKIHAQSSKYGIGSFGAYTEERMEREIAYSSSDTVMDYARSYITWVTPIDFIYATTTSEQTRAILKEEAGDLDIEKLRAETQPIHLIVDFEKNKVVGHEGRHRMLALDKAGVRKVAVVIDARYDDRHNTKPIEMMHLMGQSFGDYGHGVDFFLHDMLPLSKRYAEVAKELFTNEPKNGVQFSDRSTDSVSNRSLLANALESVAQNDIEKKKLEEYKGKIALIESEQAKLSEIRAKIKELSFAKGKRDTEAIRSLQFEEKQTANRINTYDKQLLNLESTTALKGVLEREKKMAYKRAEQRGKEALAAYRERATKTQRELLTRYQESRKKNVEGRKKTAMRHKIKDVVNELDRLLRNETKDKHIPIELKKPVAEALNAVNMDTVGAEERLAELHKKLQKDPFNHELLESYRRIAEQGERMDEKLQALKNAYDEIVNSDDPLIANSHDETISKSIEKVIKEVGDTPLRNMTLTQLEYVHDMYKMVLTTVRDANKAFAENIKMTRQALGSNTFAEIKNNNKTRDFIKNPQREKFLWQNLKPITAMKKIGSPILQNLWNNILYGQEVFATDYNDAVNFAKEMKNKHGYKKWNKDKLYQFESKSGKTMKLNLEQMMSIYAYSKRPQADEHIEFGGIVLNEGVIKVKNKLGVVTEVKVNDSSAHRLDKTQVNNIIETLKKEFPGATDFVDEMQKYLSETMGEKGNEVSMKMYGVKLFKEEHYFPLKSSKDFMESANAKIKGDVKIKNKGMTKATVPHARNPIVLENFLDVWGNHINEMSLYHGLVLPLEDFDRTINYGFKADEKINSDAESVRTALHDAFGDAADEYLNELKKAINGGLLHDSTAGWADRWISKFKKAKVIASLSVIIQQPTAIIRAMGIIEPKYFLSQNFNHKETWEELKKYCPTAIIKETGSFDTNMGRTIVDLVKEESGFVDKVGDFFGKAPAWMDEMGWNMMWRALKKKVATEQKLSGEALLKECGRQMTLIINETQVYDSVLARSELMRSKNAFTKMATAFGAEPSTVANMVYGAALDFKRGKKAVASKAVTAVIGSVVVNSLVSAIVYALRDDDEEKTFAEKYISSATSETLDGLNPLTYIPYVKDVWSVFQGYKAERTDLSLFIDVADALDKFYNVLDSEEYEGMSRKEIAEHIYENAIPLLTSIADMFGLPVGNILRDAEALIVNDNVPASNNSRMGTGYALKEGVFSASPKIIKKIFDTDTKTDKLYDAIINGDTVYVDRVKSSYDSDSDYNSAIRKALRENDPRIKEAAEARYNGDVAEYMRIAKEIIAEGNFSQDNIVAAINAEISALKTNKESGVSKPKYVTVDDYYKSIVNGDMVTAQTILDMLVEEKLAEGYLTVEAKDSVASAFSTKVKDAYMEGGLTQSKAISLLTTYGGKSYDEAETEIKKCDFELAYDVAWSERVRAYRLGKISKSTLISAVMDIEGESYEDAESYIRFLNLEMANPAVDITASDANSYFKYAEPSGISVDLFIDYKEQTRGIESDKDANGNSISGSKKAKVMAVINSLPITYAQKDALYYTEGWSASTIWEAPWH